MAGARPARAADIAFVTQPPITLTADGARSVFATDVDGDGDADAVSGSANDNTVAWHENTAGDGSVWTTHTISTAVNAVADVFAADMDGDGDADVLSVSSYNGRIAWHENTAGNGSAWTDHTIGFASAAASLAAADVDGDGDLDALSGPYGAVMWFENTAGDGSAWVPHFIFSDTGFTFSIAAADVDGDGDEDVLSANSGAGPMVSPAWYENTAGNGSTWTRHTVTPLVEADFSVAPGDVDGDGDVDIVAVSSYFDRVAWYENAAGNGSTWTPHTVATGVDAPRAAFVADVDADGDLDILSASLNDDKVAWHENTAGNGSAWTSRTISTAADRAYDVVAADLDGDGDLDVLSASFLDDKIAWYRNETIHSGACFATPPPITTAADSARSVFAADLDGDGDLDSLSASSYDDKVAWYENTAGGSVWTTHTISTAASDAFDVFAADVDGDGDMDVLSASSSDAKVAWYENVLGDGSLWTTRTITVAANGAMSVFASDVDGDGDMDVLSASASDDKVAWYENSAGDGSAWTSHTITTSADGASSAFAADVDADGDIDALSASSSDDKVAWYENSAGNGSVWTVHTITTAPNGALSVFAADVDGDGDIDALSTSFMDSNVAWYENTAGNGSAWTSHTITTVANDPWSVVAADVDGDGDLDAVVASFGHYAVLVYENTAGDGSTWKVRTAANDVQGAARAIAADVDHDGSLDLLSASSFDDKVAWYPNRGGQFSLAAADTAPPTANNGALVSMLRIDAAHLGRAGDHDLELSSLGFLLEENPGDPLTSAEANALIESLRIYRDADGNGTFEPATDVLVVSLTDLVLQAGTQSVTLADGDANVQVGFGTPRTYFVVAELTADASQQSPDQFRVTHLGLGPAASAAEDRDFDIPLRLACPADVSSTILVPVVPVQLMRFSVE